MRSILVCCLLLCLLFVSTACTPQAIALLNAVVASVEIALPAIPAPAGDLALANTYLNTTLNLVDDIVQSPDVPSKISAAISDLRSLPLPGVSDPELANRLGLVDKAIKNFLVATQPAQAALTQRSTARKAQAALVETKKEEKQLEALKMRIQRAKKKVDPKK